MRFRDILASSNPFRFWSEGIPPLFSTLFHCNKLWSGTFRAGLHDPDRLLLKGVRFQELHPDGSKDDLGGNLAGGISEIFEA
jgi:hypothetical protein